MLSSSFSWRILQLVKVLDGDTVDLKIDRGFYDTSVIRFRLLGIDTPELRSKDPEERAAGQRAKEYAVAWFEKHGVPGVDHDLHVTSFKSSSPVPNGGFGRWIGTVSCTCGDFLVDDLTAAGHAGS